MKKILIMENKEEIRVVYTELRPGGFEVVEARNAVEVVDNIIRERLTLQRLDTDLFDIQGQGYVQVSHGDDPLGKSMTVSVYLSVDKKNMKKRL
ncbi:MAG: hypothetical protein KBD53_06190 [Candidatus Omnitrophica bacterium]|nr:hypothetical protein [Candidatus Omnitrophota bacterium]